MFNRCLFQGSRKVGDARRKSGADEGRADDYHGNGHRSHRQEKETNQLRQEHESLLQIHSNGS